MTSRIGARALLASAIDNALDGEFENGKQLAMQVIDRVRAWTTRSPEPMTMDELRSYIDGALEELKKARRCR